MMDSSSAGVGETDIAIVGMAAHLPGAPDIATYWANLRAGVESIIPLSRDELLSRGEAPQRTHHPDYVPAAAILENFEHFDADFFGFSPKEAAILDPQHRQFLEVAWEALENAGHPPETFKGAIGVYAGCGMGSYFYFNLCSHRDLVENTGMFLLRHTGNDKDFLSTRVSHILDLRGPSVNVQTACSTSLVAVHYAAQALLNGECDMALAGGVTIELPHGRGYIFKEGEILSPDGHCHAFDHRAQGTVFGSGAGCVVLRRARDAIRDGDHIWAILKGSAVNNDGAAKAGYLAPSVEGQAACVAEALAIADVPAATVDYVECHGTGTYLGDPIEVAALTQGFGTEVPAGRCRIGSVKTNIGHLDTAAGVASLIKVALSLHHREIPPSLGYEAPNPAIDFDASPFRVNDRLTEWRAGDHPRRAGINSLGVGGTNAHAVLQEAPQQAPSAESDWPFQPIVLSARSKAALDAASVRLAAHLRAHPEQPLADVAYTLKEGRRAFEKRRVLVAESHAQAADLLEGADPRRVFTHDHLGDAPEVVFMFPGGGAQYPNMARGLYDTEPEFRDWMDRGLAILQPLLDYDIRALWLPARDAQDAAAARLKQPSVQLPLIMICEYALAKLYESWGVQPAALIGHSMGENTAACLAGVIGFADCIRLVHLRGRLFDTVPAGGMLSVPMDAADLAAQLEGLDLASVNAPGLCVVSGPDAALADLSARLACDGIETQRIAIDIAAHSRMLEPILAEFAAFLRSIPLSAPQLPVISNRTGLPLTAEQATSPDYWVQHLRQTVRFADGMAHLLSQPNRVFMEMGPGRALSSLAQANGAATGQVIPALRHPDQAVPDDQWHIASLARLWACGVSVDWAPIWGEGPRHRVPLPGYAFQRKPYFIAPADTQQVYEKKELLRSENLTDWGWQRHWRPLAADCPLDLPAELDLAPAHRWLIFVDDHGLGQALADRLRSAGQQVVTVRAGDAFARLAADSYCLAPERGREGYDRLLADLATNGFTPDRIAHFWSVTEGTPFRPGSSFFDRNMEHGFWSLLFLAQAIAAEDLPRPIHLHAFTTGAAARGAERLAQPEKAAINGPLRVIPRELPGITCASTDLVLPLRDRRGRRDADALSRLVNRLLEELLAEPQNTSTLLRDDRRFAQVLRPTPLPPERVGFPQGAHVFLTGGFGGIGLTLADRLARDHGVRLTIVTRQPLPDRADWPAVLAQGGEVARRIRGVERLEAAGATVLIHPADICNLAEMQAARAAAEAAFGPIHTVIHAAGTVDDGPLLTRSPAQIEGVLAPKLHGTRVLGEVFPDGSVQRIVLFSSTSAEIGAAGQVDYTAANDFLNAFAASRQGGKTQVLALGWGIWQGVGMAAAALGHRAPSLAPISRPLLAEAGHDAQGERLFTARLLPEHWVIDGHRTAEGLALLPGTGVIELMAEALAEAGQSAFALRDLYFFRPLAVEGTPRDLRLTMLATEEGWLLELRAARALRGRPGWELAAQARAVPLAAAAPQIDPASILSRCPERRAGKGMTTPQETHLRFGPRWRVLDTVALGTGEGIAALALPDEFAADPAQGWLTHPALLDIATGWAMELIDGWRPDALWVPVSYAEARIYAPLPARIISHVQNAATNRGSGPTAVFDVTLATPDGRVVAAFRGLTLRKLDQALSLPGPDARAMVFDDGAAPTSPAEARLRATLAQGIRPAEGAEAFLRALAIPGPQVFVSSLPLPDLVAAADEAADAAAPASASFDRPDLDSAYVAPRNDIERRLASFWQDLLGLGQVGVEDDFFALGGHSLIAVRLFAQVKKAFRVEFPISVLFEAPTIAACARLIEDQIGPQQGSDATTVTPIIPQRRFAHLVAMHEGAGGPGRPFFLVAGMFGNVLNLRHLAQLIGPERPFWGLQARGLYGDAAPHRRLPQAAADYIAELRQVQPHGPYLLGGFSGGGLTAWEMARQLEAEGETVSALILLDTPLPMRPPLSGTDKALIKLAELRAGGIGYLRHWARSRWEWERTRRRAPQSTDTAHSFHNAEIEAAFREAVAHYPLPLRRGPTTLFRPPLDRRWQVSGGMWVSTAKEYVFADNDLTRFAPALEVIEVPGDHDSMVLEPNVRVLAARMKALLKAADDDTALDAAAE